MALLDDWLEYVEGPSLFDEEHFESLMLELETHEQLEAAFAHLSGGRVRWPGEARQCSHSPRPCCHSCQPLLGAQMRFRGCTRREVGPGSLSLLTSRRKRSQAYSLRVKASSRSCMVTSRRSC